MLNVLKWVYRLGYKRAYDNLTSEVRALIDYHRHQEEIAYYKKDKLEDDTRNLYNLSPRLTSKEHGIVAQELYRLMDIVSPTNYKGDKKTIDNIKLF